MLVSFSMRSFLPSRRREPELSVDVDELRRRIGIVDERPAVPPEVERARAAATNGLHDPEFFAALAIPRFERAKASGAGASVVALAVDLRRRSDAPLAAVESFPAAAIAVAIRRNLRPHDVAAQAGDDGFALYLDRCDRRHAEEVIERLSRAVSEITTKTGHLMLSAGVASFPESGSDLLELLERADQVLHDVRSGGGNEIRSVANDPRLALIASI